MRRKVLWVLALFCLLALLTPAISAADPQAGTVLFAQRYGEITDARLAGIRVGTAGGTPGLRADGALCIDVTDDRKAYLLLPDLPEGGAWCDTYTVEFTFRFTEIAAPNGYFGFLMTAQGDAPFNRTEVILRAGGTCDGVGTLSDEIAMAMASGGAVQVAVFVDHGMMYEIRVRAGDNEQSLVLPTVKTVGAGSRGFVLRNASAAVESVAVISGVDNGERLGDFASGSYWIEPEETVSPGTADGGLAVWPVLALTAGCALCIRRRRRV